MAESPRSPRAGSDPKTSRKCQVALLAPAFLHARAAFRLRAMERRPRRPWSSQCDRNVFQHGFCLSHTARAVPAPVRLEALGRGWQRSVASSNARGWLAGRESSEASELGEAMRGLFMACDSLEDGQLDEKEFAAT